MAFSTCSRSLICGTVNDLNVFSNRDLSSVNDPREVILNYYNITTSGVDTGKLYRIKKNVSFRGRGTQEGENKEGRKKKFRWNCLYREKKNFL